MKVVNGDLREVAADWCKCAADAEADGAPADDWRLERGRHALDVLGSLATQNPAEEGRVLTSLDVRHILATLRDARLHLEGRELDDVSGPLVRALTGAINIMEH